MRLEAPAVALLALLTFAAILPAAMAQDDDDDGPVTFIVPAGMVIDEDTTWEDGATFEDGNITVTENATLTIRGAHVTLDNITLRTTDNASLVIESLPGKPAMLTGADDGWDFRGAGTIRVTGLPTDKVVLDGLRGNSGFGAGSQALFTGGFSVGRGSLEMTHATLRNYTAGVYVTNGATGRVDNVDFSGGKGIGFASTEVNVGLGNSTFRDEGGIIFVSVPPKPVRIENLSFTDVGTAITVRGAFVELANIRVQGASYCVNALGFDQVTIRGMECHEFQKAAIGTTPTVGSRQNTARLDVDGLHASTTDPVDGAIHATNALTLKVTNSSFGPVNGPAIFTTRITADLQGNTFQGVKDYNVVYLNPPENATFEVPGTGEPGSLGWLRVIRQSPFRIADAAGMPVNGSRFDVTTEDTNVLVFSNKSLSDDDVAPALDAFTINGRGEVRELTYRIQAGNATAGATLEHYKPTGNETMLTLLEGAVPEFKQKKSPGPGALPLLAALALLAVAARRKQR